MGLIARLQASIKGFNRLFWIANTLELFERFAFYGAKAVLAVFIAKTVGLDNEGATLAGSFTSLVYALPVIAGVFVDRYGFRKTLMACFAIFSIGYFLIAMAGMQWSEEIVAVVGKRTYVITVLVITAIGGSLIKPCIVGTVGRTTNADSRTLGFSIYYSLVNLGGAIGPVLAYFIRTGLGIEWVLITSSITSFLLMIGTYFFFSEPDADQNAEKKTFGKVFSDMIVVFTDGKFMLFLLIFSSFWIMFWQIFLLIPFYAIEILHFEQYEFLESVDAWFIIFFSLFSGTILGGWKPFRSMIFGFVVSSLSWLLIASFGNTFSVVVAIIFFALGEGFSAPRYYEYVNSLAPKSQTGTYMGFAFLPVAIGALASGVLADWFRREYMTTNPSMIWIILASIGIVSTVLLIAYDRLLVKKTS
ncbi:MAG TPA: MFS transporter [Cyclobacteriaceae bacterium]|nr:MFS transporter [Cyclobacteriaceae bacterium]